MPEMIVLCRTVALRFNFDRAILIGRHIANGLPLPDREISRRHAQIFPRDDDVVIADLGSRNGVYVNGRKYQERELRPGDEITMGRTLMFFQPPEDAVLTDLLSARGTAVWEHLPASKKTLPKRLSEWRDWQRDTKTKYKESLPDCVTTFSPVELDERIENWLEGDDSAAAAAHDAREVRPSGAVARPARDARGPVPRDPGVRS